MHADKLSWTQSGGWNPSNPARNKPDLILYFGSRQSLASGEAFDQLRARCPDAMIAGCTTGGQILNHDIVDDEVSGVAMHFETTKIRLSCERVSSAADSRACGRAIGEKLQAHDLAGIFVLSDGLNVNGSELVVGITDSVGREVTLTGGLAGDGSLFQETLVGANCAPQSHTVAGIGFYGNAIRIGHGSAGGWDVFGPWRHITRSQGNVLFELDGEPALNLYELYLGDEAEGLPGSGLLFPLQINDPNCPDHKIVRTILAVDRDQRSLTFAGDVPEGWSAQLMRGNFNRLALGAADAARQARDGLAENRDCNGVAVLVSCIGRRLLMGQRTAEEVEMASAELGSRLTQLGFYSYGEISPHAVTGTCKLHNQTMTVTAIAEAAT